MGVLGVNGLTAAEHRQIIRSEYALYGVLSGCELIASSSSMTLTLNPGAAVVPVSGTEAVVAPIPSATLTLDAAPGSGQDVYDICVTVSGSAVTVSKVKNGALPANSIRIERWIIPAGASNARAGYAANMRSYAVPVGAGQSRIVDWQDPTGYGGDATRGRFTQLTRQIYLPQDRLLEFRISQTFSAKRGEGKGCFQWLITDSVAGRVTTPVLPYDEWPAGGGPMLGSTYQHSYMLGLTAGYHTITWERQQITGGQPIHAAGTTPAAEGSVTRPANRLEVFDVGIVA